MSPEAQRRMTDAAIKSVADEITAKTKPAEDDSHHRQAMMAARMVCQKALNEAAGRIKLMPLPPSKAEAFDILLPLLRDGFKSFSHDDIIYLNSLCHATLCIDGLSDLCA